MAGYRGRREIGARDREGGHPLLVPFALFAALNAITLLYLATTHTVFVWDNAGYWTVARALAQEPLGLGQLVEVLRTTQTMDYNYLLAFPISLVMRVFGGSRGVFLLCISNLYTFPALLGLCKLAKGRGAVLCALFPMVIYIGLVGYVDVAACACAIWAVAVYLDEEKEPLRRGAAAGVLLVASFLLRRYFFFFAASFGVAALAVKLFFERKHWRDFLALGVTGVVCSLLFAFSFLWEKVFGTDYGDLYSAYAQGLMGDVLLFSRYFGLCFLAALVTLAVIKLVRGESGKPITFALVQMAACFAAFSRVQSHGQQHLLLYLPAFALLAAALLSIRWTVLVAVVMTAVCFWPNAQPASIGEIAYPALLPSIDFYGPSRGDIGELTALADYLDGLSASEPKTAVVLASSFTLNSETLTNLRPSLNLPEPEVKTTIRYQGTVDKRDPFNWNTLTADYLVVGDPLQTHLGEGNQQVMALFAADVLAGEGPGSAYVPLPRTFSLENGCTVRVFQRTRNLTGEEYRLISARLQDLYPEYADLYAVPAWVE